MMIWTLIGTGCSESERENTNEERWLSISQKRVCVLCFQRQTTNTETSPDVGVSVVVESCMYCIESGYHSFQCDVWMCYCTIVDNVNLSEWEAAACFEKSEVFSVSDLLTMAQRSFVVAATKLNFLWISINSTVLNNQVAAADKVIVDEMMIEQVFGKWVLASRLQPWILLLLNF